MKNYVLLLAAMFTGCIIYAQSGIVANITKFSNNKGVCRACLFDKAEAFAGKGAPVKCVQVSIINVKAQAVFMDIAPGTYAVSVFHDANNNNEFDTNFLGIPKEGYGASRNNLPFAAAPGFKENSLEIKNNTITTITIKLRYL